MQILDFKPLQYRALYEPSFENKHRLKAGPVTFADEKQLIRIAEETFKNTTASRHLFPVSQNLLYFILFYFCHTFPLSVWRPYCQVTPRVRRCVVRNFWPWSFALKRTSKICNKAIWCNHTLEFYTVNTLVSIIHDTLIILWTSNTSNSAIHKTKTVIKWRPLLVNSICVSMQLIRLQEGISVPVL